MKKFCLAALYFLFCIQLLSAYEGPIKLGKYVSLYGQKDSWGFAKKPDVLILKRPDYNYYTWDEYQFIWQMDGEIYRTGTGRYENGILTGTFQDLRGWDGCFSFEIENRQLISYWCITDGYNSCNPMSFQKRDIFVWQDIRN